MYPSSDGNRGTCFEALSSSVRTALGDPADHRLRESLWGFLFREDHQVLLGSGRRTCCHMAGDRGQNAQLSHQYLDSGHSIRF
jgi:hypothetical protein